jgi:hypothetical protein
MEVEVEVEVMDVEETRFQTLHETRASVEMAETVAAR